MSLIPTPASIEATPEAAQPLLAAVKKSLGTVPNLFRLIANSPAALEGYLGLNGALARGQLDPKTRERIALAVANVNRCGYCNAAHTVLGRMAKLDEAEIAAARHGRSADARANVAVAFARKVAEQRGAVNEADLHAVKASGFSDAELVEIVAHVALNTLTNYVNEVFKTEIDFPAAKLAEVA